MLVIAYCKSVFSVLPKVDVCLFLPFNKNSLLLKYSITSPVTDMFNCNVTALGSLIPDIL